VIVRLEDSDWLARLHQQSFVVLQLLQSFDDGAIGFPAARGAPGSAIDDEVFGAFGDFLVEVIHEHAHGGFLLPAFAGDLVAARGANRSGRLGQGFDGHEFMVLGARRARQIAWDTGR